MQRLRRDGQTLSGNIGQTSGLSALLPGWNPQSTATAWEASDHSVNWSWRWSICLLLAAASSRHGLACVQGVVVCQHGPDECSLNRVINCAQSLHPDQVTPSQSPAHHKLPLRSHATLQFELYAPVQDEWFPFVRCLEESATPDVQQRAAGCAKTADLGWDDIHSCATGGSPTICPDSCLAGFHMPAEAF